MSDDAADGERDDVARARAGRVTAVHAQTRPTLVVAGLFCVAAAVAAVVPHDTGSWLPLHLFLVGGVLAAISGATQMLAVTWSNAPAPPSALVAAQRAVLVTGVVVLAVGREADAPSWVVGLGGVLVVAALVLLGWALVLVRRRAGTPRFRPAIEGYLVALVFGTVGSQVGVAAATGEASSWGDARTAHLTANLLGLVGLVVAATLPWFVATQLRSKMAPTVTPDRLRGAVALLGTGAAVAMAGALGTWPAVGALGDAAYAVGILVTLSLCPRPTLRQARWAGPRLAMLALGVAWWLGGTVALAVDAGGGEAPGSAVLVALAVGGYGQVLAGSLAYLGPVLRGGGHVRLAAGFRLTASWLGVAAANVGVVGVVAGWWAVAVVGLGVWVGDALVRALLLARRPSAA